MEYDYSFDVIEKILVKKSLTDKKYLNVISEIFDTRWFENDKNHGLLVRMAIGYYKKYDKLPTNKVMNALIQGYCEKNNLETKDLSSALMDINSFNLDVDDDAANRNLEKYIKDKMIYFATSDGIQSMMKTGNVDGLVSKFDQIQKLTFEDDDIGLQYFSKEGQDKHWEYLKNPEAKISTGWNGLDRYTNFGIPKEGKFLGLILAQSGLGKSLFLSNLAVNFLSQDLTVGVISLEMSENVYAQRFSAHISGDNVNRLKDTADSSRSKIEKFYMEHPKANLIIKEYPPRSINSRKIDSYIEKLREHGIKLDVLIVDYLNLVVPNKKGDNMFQDGMLVSEELRALSYKWEIPIMSAVQANTEGMGNENIDMENVSQSRGIVFTADFIGALYQLEQDKEAGNITMRLIKNRLGGEVGKTIPFAINKQNLKVVDNSFGMIDVSANSEVDNISNNLSNISDDMQDI